MILSAFNLTNAVGAAGFLLSLIAYCLIRRINNGGQTLPRLYCCARTCFIVGLLKMGIGIFEITYFSSTGGTWWGWILILFSIVWIVRGNKFRTQAANMSVGYQPFNHESNLSEQSNGTNNTNNIQPRRSSRISNAPQVVIVSENPSSTSILSSSIYPGGIAAPNVLQPPIMSNFDQPLIRNAVPPSPFIGTQGSNSYIVPSIPMAITITPRSGSNTPISDTHTHTHTHTQPHAEDSIYISDDDKNDIEPETPKGAPERKTSEGNVTFS